MYDSEAVDNAGGGGGGGGDGGRRRRRSMVAEGGEFNADGSVRRRRRWGLRIGNDEATMEIDIGGGVCIARRISDI